MDADIHMLLEGTIAELIVKLDPTLYRRYYSIVNSQAQAKRY